MYTLFVGGYGGTVYTLYFDPTALTLTHASSISAGTAPTWLLLHPNGKLLYSCDEFAKDEGVISAFLIAEDGKLELLETTRSGGGGPVHLALSADAGRLCVANYAGASLGGIVIKEDGRFPVSKQSQVFSFTGQGPQQDRQEAPHPHGVFLEPTGTLLLLADLGTDTLRIFTSSSSLSPLLDLPMTPGSGPRHLLFSTTPTHTLLYLLTELHNTIEIYSLSYPTSSSPLSLTLLQSTSFLPINQPTLGAWTGAELALTPSKSHLIVSNRAPDDPAPKDGTDVLTVFAVDAEGMLRGVPTFEAVGGLGLRHFALGGEEGRWVAVGCQKTDEVVVFERRGGELEEVARVGGAKQPTVVVWG